MDGLVIPMANLVEARGDRSGGTRIRRAVVVAVATLLLSAQRPAAGAPGDAAREASKRGAAAYNLGSYDEAAKYYEEAYRLIQSPDLLFNIGQSWRQAGKTEKALTAYKSYLRTSAADAPNRELVERRVLELERMASETRKTQAAPPLGSLPAREREVFSPPSAAALASSSPTGPTAPVRFNDTPEPTPPVYKRWWFWTGAGALVMGVVVGAVLSSGGESRATSCGIGLDSCAPVRR